MKMGGKAKRKFWPAVDAIFAASERKYKSPYVENMTSKALKSPLIFLAMTKSLSRLGAVTMAFNEVVTETAMLFNTGVVSRRKHRFGALSTKQLTNSKTAFWLRAWRSSSKSVWKNWTKSGEATSVDSAVSRIGNSPAETATSIQNLCCDKTLRGLTVNIHKKWLPSRPVPSH